MSGRNGDERTKDRASAPPLRDRLANAAFLAVIRLARMLPYHRRLPAAGWFFARILAPLAGWRRRIRENLALTRPDLDRTEIERLVRAVPDNIGRSMIETYSGAEFVRHTQETARMEGPGLAALEAAFAEKRPVVLACAHIGNYDAMRAAMVGRGWPFGGLYRPMNNPLFNAHYTEAITSISEPLFPRGRRGLAAMLRHLRAGGWLAIAIDQASRDGEMLTFFGQPARTALTAADLALRHDALLLQAAAIRQPDGLRFRILIDDPIAPGEPAAMMQELNDRLEALVRRHMDQWLWVHRRWK
ncbi:lysophospholipid acyltransferase family protein [Paracoccus marinaquae]|uniref:Lysophospholipid acyltransferase family protein n=1 Tax=Paracoccus marinaquae TaxID=2841926 RepID=A0ABS6AJT0_9RHOB|nr:lysophospholipid acyltransferase family protein [Paracoccus marinaquae]MBU3030845.1 lysophospholipid acyltransferase family protein [Paracoccus marinaquae]